MFKPLSFAFTLGVSLVFYTSDVSAEAVNKDSIEANKDSSSNPWTELAITDLKQIYQTVKADHPGAVDDQNPYFKAWLEQGYREGITRAKHAESLQDTLNTLRYYVAGFADGHFGLSLNYQARTQTWVGIGLAKRGRSYQVTFQDENWPSELPPLGASLISCDGRNPSKIMNDEILKYRFNNLELNSRKVRYAKKILIDDGIGERTHPESCLFDISGEQQSYKLSWKKASTTKLMNKLRLGKLPTQFELIEFKPNHFWVTLPNFYPNADEEVQLKAIIEQMKALRNAELLVFDVRGNGGGSSQWGRELASGLYGKKYIDNVIEHAPDNSYALWRVSSENIAHLDSINGTILTQFGVDSEIFKEFSQTEQNMKASLLSGDLFVKQASSEESETSIKLTPPPITEESLYKGKTVLLTDSYCGSACLDFADLSLSIPGLVHMGEETSADTVYMDIRMVTLKSGLGQFSLAQKVYRDRPRANNQSYIPQYLYQGKMTDTDGLQKWVIESLTE